MYILMGMLHIKFGLWIGCWSIVGSMIALVIIGKLIQRFNRQSPIAMLMCFISALSGIMTPIIGSIDLID